MLDRNLAQTPVLSAELAELANAADTEIAGRLQTLATRQSEAEAVAPALIAQQMLAFVEDVSIYDDTAASHLLKGLLRHAAGQHTSSVEKTAIRIAGLANMGMGELVLTDEGNSLLAKLGNTDHEDAETAAEEPATVQHQAPVERKPFAQLRFGDRSFEIADGDAEDSLMFRSRGDDIWIALENDRGAGWDVVGAEMLSKSIDVHETYTHMHSIRLAAPELGQGAHVFELEHLRWWLKIEGNKALFTTDPKAGWTLIPADILSKDIRSLGLAAAERLIPNFRAKVSPDVKAWVRRMALAAAIMPITPALG